MSLFPDLSGARFSECRRYRYELWRRWDEDKPVATFVMLNPSTADENANDPTVERCQRRAVQWGFGGLCVANIFAFRSTDPAGLYEVSDPVGVENDKSILALAQRSGIVVCAWGTHGSHAGRGHEVERLLRLAGVKMHSLGVNSDGTPKHPLYVGYEIQPMPYP